MYNPFTLREIQEKYPYIQWVDYINALLSPPLSVDENETVVVLTPTFFVNLGQLLDETPPRVIANYLMWRITRFSSAFLTNEMRNRQLVYNKAVSGQQQRPPRWKECIAFTRNR